MKIISLTDYEMELLTDALGNHFDRGPEGYGWQSPELEDLIKVIDRQVNGGVE